MKTASEMTYIVSSGALNSTPTNYRTNFWKVADRAGGYGVKASR